MPNEQEKFGLPQVLIDFKTKGVTAIKRSARGVVALILKCETTDVSNKYKISDISEIPDRTFDDATTDLIKKCLDGTPLRVLVYTLPKTCPRDHKIAFQIGHPFTTIWGMSR